jgi:hypothetical protein
MGPSAGLATKTSGNIFRDDNTYYRCGTFRLFEGTFECEANCRVARASQNRPRHCYHRAVIATAQIFLQQHWICDASAQWCMAPSYMTPAAVPRLWKHCMARFQVSAMTS